MPSPRSNKPAPTRRPLTRRHALALGLSGTLSLATPAIVRAETPYKRSLALQSLNSGEKLTIVYWADGAYLPEALTRINWFMRDLRSHQAKPMSPKLLDLLWDIDQLTPSTNPLYTLSAYRSPETNAKLARASSDVDEHSFHMRGMAIDVTQDFRHPEILFRAATQLARGGSGFYPTKRPFVHIDVGPVDTWVWPNKGRPNRAADYDRLQANQPLS